MKPIKYQVQIKFMSKDGKEVKLDTYASSEKELIKNLEELFKPKSKFLSFFLP